jgi:hypothetical protein
MRNQLMLFWDIDDQYSENQTNAHYVQKTQNICNVETGGTYSNHYSLKSSDNEYKFHHASVDVRRTGTR